MKISKNSWHYRVVSRISNQVPTNIYYYVMYLGWGAVCASLLIGPKNPG